MGVTKPRIAPVTLARPRRVLPPGLSELDRRALAFWFRLSPEEQARSQMRPTHALARLAKLEGRR